MKQPQRLNLLGVIMFLLFISLISCAGPKGSGTEVPLSSPIAPGARANVTPSPSAVPDPGVGNWVIAGEPPRGLVGSPSEQFFIFMVELKRIDTMGGELTVNMNPVVDPSCSQKFKVGWVFERDVGMVMEGDTINVTVFNEPSGGLNGCYGQAKNAMAYGGEVSIELMPVTCFLIFNRMQVLTPLFIL